MSCVRVPPVEGQRKVDFYTPLHVAVERGLFEAARRLVELGADINAIAKVTSKNNNVMCRAERRVRFARSCYGEFVLS